jgi:hypothetical protein
MLFDGETVRLLDFDRSERGFAEIDVLHLWCDWRTHRDGPVSYSTFLRQARDCVQETARYNEAVRPLYEEVPALAANAAHQSFIARAFYLRTLAYVMQDCAARGVNALLFDEIRARS